MVGVDDAITNILSSLYFLQEQGCGTTHAVIYQDNKSAILLESNGKFSSGKQTKHIKARYFFVTDKVANGDVVIKHIPTNKMWADMNTKPKQGGPFRKDRSLMMNCDEILRGEHEVTTDMDAQTASHIQMPHPKHYRDVSTVVQTQAQPRTTPRISWSDAKECVGSAQHLGTRSSPLMMPALCGASKRLLS